jgi:predicted permease
VPIDASPSIPVLLFAFAIALVTGVVFGIAPAWISARVDPIEALRGASRATQHQGVAPRKALVVLQTAVSLILLSSAGLLTAVLQRLQSQNLGFETSNRLVASHNPRLAGYRTSQLPALYARIRNSIANLPGVESVALCLYSPPNGGWGARVWLDGSPVAGPAYDNSANWDRVGAGYFEVVGTRVVRGRGVSEKDTASSRKVAVVNQAFARRFFGTGNPIGRHFGREPEESREFEVVGVVEDARYWPYSLEGPATPMFFLPEAQADYSQSNIGSLFLHETVIAVKPGTHLAAPAIQQALAAAAPDLPVLSIHTLDEQVAQQFTQQRMIARLTTLFAVLSLVLASIGVYGVTAYNAGRRATEIGVRIALGATRPDVIRLVVQGAFGLFLFGLLVGLPIMMAFGRLLGSQLYGMRPYDPVVTVIAVLALGASALVSSFIPALRASLVPPANVLRSE